jgi:hypothetical protein
MRTALLALILVEGLALVGGAGTLLVAGDGLTRKPPEAPVFRPLLPDAVPGDSVRYRREDPKTGEEIGYLDYRVLGALDIEGLGREFEISIEESGKQGTRQRRMHIRPRSSEHGFLPPRLNEDELDRIPGARPVIRRIRTAPVTVRGRERPGFVVETVVPRDGLDRIRERYWMSEAVPVFGVARIERPDEVLVLHAMERVKP